MRLSRPPPGSGKQPDRALPPEARPRRTSASPPDAWTTRPGTRSEPEAGPQRERPARAASRRRACRSRWRPAKSAARAATAYPRPCERLWLRSGRAARRRTSRRGRVRGRLPEPRLSDRLRSSSGSIARPAGPPVPGREAPEPTSAGERRPALPRLAPRVAGRPRDRAEGSGARQDGRGWCGGSSSSAPANRQRGREP
jgi:hypothetical protein